MHGIVPLFLGIRCILQIDSFPAFVVTIFLFPQAAELHSSKTSLYLSCFCCVRHVFDLSGHCNDMQAFLVICPLSKQARQEIDDLQQTLAAREESDTKAVMVLCRALFHCFWYQVYSPN